MAGCEPDDPFGILEVSPDAARLGIKVAVMTACLAGEPGDPRVLEREIEWLEEWARSAYTLESLREDPVVRAYRRFYWRIGVDPTKTRPSSEALVRRLLRGRFPRISPVVDAGNIASARSMIPIGLYDLDRAKPPLRIVLSRGGEVFEPIGGGREELPPGLPILVDSQGLVMHLYPHRDSVHTMIRPETRRLLALFAGVRGVGEDRLRMAIAILVSLLQGLGWRTSAVAVLRW